MRVYRLKTVHTFALWTSSVNIRLVFFCYSVLSRSVFLSLFVSDVDGRICEHLPRLKVYTQHTKNARFHRCSLKRSLSFRARIFVLQSTTIPCYSLSFAFLHYFSLSRSLARSFARSLTRSLTLCHRLCCSLFCKHEMSVCLRTNLFCTHFSSNRVEHANSATHCPIQRTMYIMLLLCLAVCVCDKHTKPHLYVTVAMYVPEQWAHLIPFVVVMKTNDDSMCFVLIAKATTSCCFWCCCFIYCHCEHTRRNKWAFWTKYTAEHTAAA